jgi:hypothetical protein
MGDSPNRDEPSISIVAVAAVQFLGSLAILLLPAVLLTDEIHFHRWYPAAYQPKSAGFYVVLVALPICLSRFGVITSIGVVRQRVWARRVTLFFATIPTLICVLWLILHHPRAVGDSSLLVVGELSNALAAYLLVVLAPISLWWWILFTGKSVRSQFRGRSSFSSQAQISK